MMDAKIFLHVIVLSRINSEHLTDGVMKRICRQVGVSTHHRTPMVLCSLILKLRNSANL